MPIQGPGAAGLPDVQVLTDDGSGTWVQDVTALVRMPEGIVINRGRGDEYDAVEPSTLQLTTDRTAGDASIGVGTPVRVKITAGGVTRTRFTGVGDTARVGWPSGVELSLAPVTAVDRLATLSRRTLDSVLTETLDSLSPTWHWPLTEAEGATSAGEMSGNAGQPLAIAQRGTAGKGTLVFGSGTGAATENVQCVTITRDSATVGPYLTGPAPAMFRVVCAVVATTTKAAQTFVRWRNENSNQAGAYSVGEFGCDGAGMATFAAPDLGVSITSTVDVTDGLPHVFGVFRDAQDFPTLGPKAAFTFYVDGAQVGTANLSISLSQIPQPITHVDVGGSQSGSASQAAASISHLAIWSEGSNTIPGTYATAARDGFATDSSDERIARYAGWAGVTDLALETGYVVDVAHLDTAGSSIADAMQTVTKTEEGLLFVDGDGQLVLHARSHRWGKPVAMTISAEEIDPSATFSLDTQDLVNVARITRPFGPTQLAKDPASIAAYDERRIEETLLYTTDAEAAEAAIRIVNWRSQPTWRLAPITLDLLTLRSSQQAAALALELGDIIEITGLPATSPVGSSVQVFIEGWTETISDDAWTLALNTSAVQNVWILEHATYGALGPWRLS